MIMDDSWSCSEYHINIQEILQFFRVLISQIRIEHTKNLIQIRFLNKQFFLFELEFLMSRVELSFHCLFHLFC